MTDIVDKKTRSRMMSGIGGKNTKPELFVRKCLHSRGFRFRIHRKDLPGKPDIVLPKFNAVILVNGCFWHGHNCHLFKWPKTRPDFWQSKIAGNKDRDRRNIDTLLAGGWRVFILWECAIKGSRIERQSQTISDLVEWIKGESTFAETAPTSVKSLASHKDSG